MDADRVCREGLGRRPSFRKSLAEAGLPPEYLEKLEQKRRNLDESIHKYVASKEREYKLFEKELKLQRKLALREEGVNAEEDSLARRSFSEGSQLPSETPHDGRHEGSVGKEAGGTADSQASLGEGEQPMGDGGAQKSPSKVGLQQQRGNEEAFEGSDGRQRLERTVSAPTRAQFPNDFQLNELDLHRANSDTSTQTRPRKPVHLQLAHRTSSSGSSADGRLLISALKSANSARNQGVRKRVSIAVGDVIVAPADNVPVPLSNNRRASHSRSRTPAPGRASQIQTVPIVEESPPVAQLEANVPSHRASHSAIGSSLLTSGLSAETEAPTRPAQLNPTDLTTSPLEGDIGDMWHLEDADDARPMSSSNPESDVEDDLSADEELRGRRGVAAIPESNLDTVNDELDQTIDLDGQDDMEQIEFQSASASASRHPTSPGFRRPSVIADPGFTRGNFAAAQYEAEAYGIYGSSYIRPSSKGSFTAGSLGESYMARHADYMSQLRESKRHPEK